MDDDGTLGQMADDFIGEGMIPFQTMVQPDYHSKRVMRVRIPRAGQTEGCPVLVMESNTHNQDSTVEVWVDGVIEEGELSTVIEMMKACL